MVYQLLHQLSLLFGKSEISAAQFRQLVGLYSNLPLLDKISIHSRLLCIQPIMSVLNKYLPQNGVILDLGCGYGLVSNLLALESERLVIGVELSAPRIATALQSIKDRRNIEFHAADIALFDIPRCDAILLLDVLYMLPEVVKCTIVNKAYENLADDGLLIVKDTDKSPRWKYIYTYLEECVKLNLGVGGHKSLRIPQYKRHSEFEFLFHECGFSLIEVINIKSIMPYPGIIYVCRKI
ncbi:methyltransferase domain-containing protein [Candidatus Poribacteria bacterium]|nr:methyltransferase domain-containing protein [Candidatus Poribacteria bacterium]